MPPQTSEPDIPDADAFLKPLGGYESAIGAAVKLYRILWSLAFGEIPGLNPSERNYRTFRTADVFDRLEAKKDGLPITHKACTALIDRLIGRKLCWLHEDQITFRSFLFQPIRLVRAVLAGVRSDHDLRYFAMRSIRYHYNCVLSSTAAHAFHTMASELNSKLFADGPSEIAPNIGVARPGVAGNGSRRVDYHKTVLACLHKTIKTYSLEPTYVDLFIECCLAAEYLA